MLTHHLYLNEKVNEAPNIGIPIHHPLALGEHAKEHAGAIAARLEDEGWDVRCAALEALGGLGDHAKEHAGAIAKKPGEIFTRGEREGIDFNKKRFQL